MTVLDFIIRRADDELARRSYAEPVTAEQRDELDSSELVDEQEQT